MQKANKYEQRLSFMRPVNCFIRRYQSGGKIIIAKDGLLEPYDLDVAPDQLLYRYAVITTAKEALDWVKEYGFPAYNPDSPRYSEDIDTIINSANNIRELIYVSDTIRETEPSVDAQPLASLLVERSPSSQVLPMLELYAETSRPAGIKGSKKFWNLLQMKHAGKKLSAQQEDVLRVGIATFRTNQYLAFMTLASAPFAYGVKDRKLASVPLTPFFVEREALEQNSGQVHWTAVQACLVQATNIMLSHSQPRLELKWAENKCFPVWGNRACCPWDVMALAFATLLQSHSAPAKSCPICGVSLADMRMDASVCRRTDCRRQASRKKSKQSNPSSA